MVFVRGIKTVLKTALFFQISDRENSLGFGYKERKREMREEERANDGTGRFGHIEGW